MTSRDQPRHETPEQHLTERELLHVAASIAILILCVGVAILSFMAGLTWLGVISSAVLAAALVDLTLLSLRHSRRRHGRVSAG
ncbi:hypothetical protein [Microbispora hainanensis]|uniref:Uncharacterized protein n=1 Tax=Microbispora hainanensis TaxID=568844 RepID=A0A544YPY3_9ACTN|nr:hypothetical protein [Microbispora hainanensis]TQS18622.1 hypothetical protein FLX08_24095 [Microbispora hainanensis]